MFLESGVKASVLGSFPTGISARISKVTTLTIVIESLSGLTAANRVPSFDTAMAEADVGDCGDDVCLVGMGSVLGIFAGTTGSGDTRSFPHLANINISAAKSNKKVGRVLLSFSLESPFYLSRLIRLK